MAKGWSRREILRSAVLIAPLALVATSAKAARLLPATTPAPVSGPFADLQPGAAVGACKLVKVGAVAGGSVAFTLMAPDGRAFVVDVMKHDPATPGVARAGSLAVYVRNAGGGSKRTDEEQGLGAMALAGLLARREAAGGSVPALSTLRGRASRKTTPPGVGAAAIATKRRRR